MCLAIPGKIVELVPGPDRWAIVAYVRALQRAQNASHDDVPADQQGSIR